MFYVSGSDVKLTCFVVTFQIAENDELPHKICFRCSAKIEELDEFIQKCINTQANLSKAIGKNGPLFTKTRSRILWEEQLNKSNVTNDDICDAVIKKAMEGIKSIDLTATSHKAPRKLRSDNFKTSLESITEAENELDDTDQVLPQPTPKPTTTVNNKSILESSPSAVTKRYVNKPLLKELAPTINFRKPSLFKPVINTTEAASVLTVNKVIKKEKDAEVEKTFSLGTSVDSTAIVKCAPEPDPAPFDIMDHVITLKVTGVGTLFQCQLCKRNFLKKDVLATHGCTTQKLDLRNRYIQPALPKAPVVKYINTRENKTEPEENNTILNVEAKKSEIKQYRPGPKSRVGPASVQNVINDSPTVNSSTVERPSSSKETIKRPCSMDDIQETPSKIVRLQPRIAETTSSNTSKPYPVGIFQAVPHHSRVTSNPAPFYASDAKKQSCTVIQTDSPGKLLISTKPRVDLEVARKPNANLESRKTSMVQPFRVTSEKAAPTKPQQYFTFINVDPLVQPSYVLPTGE